MFSLFLLQADEVSFCYLTKEAPFRHKSSGLFCRNSGIFINLSEKGFHGNFTVHVRNGDGS